VEQAYLTVIILTHFGFAAIFMFLYYYRRSEFLTRFAGAWLIEAFRAGVLLARAVGWSFSFYWFAAVDVLYPVANWLFFSGAASFIGRRLSRKWPAIYLGLTIPLILATYLPRLHLISGFEANAASVNFDATLIDLLISYIPGGAIRLLAMIWFFKYWRRTRLPGALIVAIFFLPHALGSLATPAQYYISSFPPETFLFWFFHVFGLSTGFTILVLNEQLAEREKAELALKESERKYRTIFENVQDVYYQTDLEGRLVEISPSVQRYSGYAREELIGVPAEALYFDPAERARLLHEIQAKGEVSDFEVLMRSKKGAPVEVSVNAHLLLGRDGVVKGVEGSLRDISRRKQTETILARLAAIVESSHEAIYSYDLQGIVLDWNPGAETTYGYSAWEIKGRPVSVLIPQEQQHDFSEILSRVKQGEHVKNYDTLRLKKNGDRINVLASTSPMRDSTGKIAGVSALEHDITLEKRALLEKERQETSRKMLLVLMHEVFNPLTGILGNVTLMEWEELSPAARESLKEIKYCAERINTILLDLRKLDMSEPRIITGGEPQKPLLE